MLHAPALCGITDGAEHHAVEFNGQFLANAVMPAVEYRFGFADERIAVVRKVEEERFGLLEGIELEFHAVNGCKV